MLKKSVDNVFLLLYFKVLTTGTKQLKTRMWSVHGLCAFFAVFRFTAVTHKRYLLLFSTYPHFLQISPTVRR